MFGEAPPPTDPARESGVGSLCMDSSGMSAPLRRAAMSARVSTCTCPSTLFRAAAARAAMTCLSFFSTAISSWSSGDSKSHGRGCHWSHVQRERTCFLASSVDISVICWCNCDCGCGEDHRELHAVHTRTSWCTSGRMTYRGCTPGSTQGFHFSFGFTALVLYDRYTRRMSTMPSNARHKQVLQPAL